MTTAFSRPRYRSRSYSIIWGARSRGVPRPSDAASSPSTACSLGAPITLGGGPSGGGLSGEGLLGEWGALFSYAAEYAEVARRTGTASRSAARPLFIHPLPEPGPEWRQVEIDRLIDFFSHPIRFLLRERLGIHLGAGEAELPASGTLSARPAGRIPAGRAAPAAVPRGCRRRRDRGDRPGRQRVASWGTGPHRAAKRVAGTGPIPRRPHPPRTYACPW